jgi:hypothetical protein
VRNELHQFVKFYVQNDANNLWHGGDWPRTNNSLESANRQFKDRATNHRLLPIREFIKIAPEQMEVSSRSPDHQVFTKLKFEK